MVMPQVIGLFEFYWNFIGILQQLTRLIQTRCDVYFVARKDRLIFHQTHACIQIRSNACQKLRNR